MPNSSSIGTMTLSRAERYGVGIGRIAERMKSRWEPSGPAVGVSAGHLRADARARARQSEQVPVRAAVWVGTQG